MKATEMFFFVLAVGAASSVFGRPLRVQVAALVAESDIVVVAAPTLIAREEPRDGCKAGRAEMAVLEVLRGRAPERLELTWTEAIYDQPIDDALRLYVLFLKLGKDGSVRPTRNGVSYWPLERFRDPDGRWTLGAATDGYPLGNLVFGGVKGVSRGFAVRRDGRTQEELAVIYLPDIRQLAGERP